MDKFGGLSQDQMVNQAQQIWSMLDEMAESDPQKYKQFIDKQVKEGKEHHTPPDPHMCVQTTVEDTNQSERIFINFCEWKQVPMPKSADDPVPVAASVMSRDKDDQGSYRLASVAFNPEILKQYGRDSKLIDDQTTLVYLALDCVEMQNKHIKIFREFKILGKKCTHKGDLRKVRESIMKKMGVSEDKLKDDLDSLKNSFDPLKNISSDSLLNDIANIVVTDSTAPANPEPKIELNTNNKTSKPGLIQELSSTNNVFKTPQYELKLSKKGNDGRESIDLRIVLPGVASVNECDLDISQDDINLVVPDKYTLLLALPRKVDEDSAKAKFNKKTNTLTITVPVL